jgi:hypothetical protein
MMPETMGVEHRGFAEPDRKTGKPVMWRRFPRDGQPP